MKILKKIVICLLLSSILCSTVAYAYPPVNTTDPESTESNISVNPKLTLEEQTVSDNITHTIHWNKSLKGYDVEIYNRVTFRYKDITTLSSNDLGKIATFGDLQKTIADLPWSYESLDLAKITDDAIRSDWGEYSVNFSNILQAYINNSEMSVEDARSPFWRIYQYYVNQIRPLKIKDIKSLNMGFDFEKAYNNVSNYEKNAYYFLQSIPYGEKEGCMVQYDRVEYFVRFCKTTTEKVCINDLKPAADGRYHYKFSGNWVYLSNSPYPLINGWFDISFAQPVALFLEGGEDGYTNSGYYKTQAFEFNPRLLYKSPTKTYGDNLSIGDSEMNFISQSFADSYNINFERVSGWTLGYRNINVNSIITPLNVTGSYINNVREPKLNGKINISYDEYQLYADSAKDTLRQPVTKDFNFGSYFYSLSNPWETGFFANSVLPAFKTQQELTDYFNGQTYDKISMEYTPCYPVLKSWNDDSQTTVNKPSSTTVNYINYDTNIDDILDETDNESDDEYIRLLKKLNNTDKKILAVLKGIGTFDNFYNKLKPLIDNISGTLNNVDLTLSNIYEYLKNLTFDTSSDDKPDLTNIETLLTNILNAIDIPDYSQKLTDILNAIDIPDYSQKLIDILNAIDIPDYSQKLTDILNAIDIPDYSQKLTDILNAIDIPDYSQKLNDIKQTLNDILDKLDNLEVKVKNVFDTGILENIVQLFQLLSEDYNIDVDKKFPFCFIFALITLCGALVGEPELPTFHIPNQVEIFGYNLDLSVNQTFDVLNHKFDTNEFAMSLDKFGEFIRIVILLLFIYYFGLFVFDTVRKVE